MSTPRFPLDTTPHSGHTGLMKRLLNILALWGCLACAALAEQRVLFVRTYPDFDGGAHSDSRELDALLLRGWRIVSVTIPHGGDDGNRYTAVFVLESPAPKEPVKP